LVATTASSREISFRKRRPVTTSLAPSPYMSAVSKKVTPASIASLTIGSAPRSSRIQSRLEVSPKLIMPSASLETWSPLPSSRTCSIMPPPHHNRPPPARVRC
jgi:hypothetical protein